AGPLARIRLYAELMQVEAGSLEPSQRGEQFIAWSERIVAGTSTMKTIIQELLDVARLEMGEALQLDLRRTDLITLARRCIAELQMAGQRIRLESSADQVVGWWDESRLSRVLSNVLDNALKYSLSDADVVVTVSAPVDDGWVMLGVRDQGVGIAR